MLGPFIFVCVWLILFSHSLSKLSEWDDWNDYMCKGRRLLVILGGLNYCRSIITLVCTSLPPNNFWLWSFPITSLLINIPAGLSLPLFLLIWYWTEIFCCIVTHIVFHPTCNLFFMTAEMSNLKVIWYIFPHSILCWRHKKSVFPCLKHTFFSVFS